ncbi:hypothetical protein Tco_1499322 [Tanacetum coccineum]
MEKFFKIFQDLDFDISFAEALLFMPKFAYMIKRLLTNKDKLFELAKIPLNENCSAMLLKKLPEKLGDPDKFLIPCDFLGMDFKRIDPLLALRKSQDVFVKVGKFHFPTDFVVVDFDVDPRVPLILGYSSTYDDMSVNRIDVIDVACEEYAQEVLGFSNNSTGGNPTPTSEPIISDSSLSLTPFEGSDFILEEIEAYLKDDSISPEIDHADFDLEGDLRLIEELLNNDPSSPLPLSHNPLSSSTTFSSPSLTPVETSDALLEEFADELALLEPFPPGIGDDDFDPEGDILLLEKFLNDDPSSPLPPKELNFEKLKMIKSSIDDFPLLDFLEEKFIWILRTDIENSDHDSEGDIIYLESLLIDDTIPNLPSGVFLDHDPRSLKDKPDNDDFMNKDKKRISEKRTKNQAKNDKTEHGMEKREKDKVKSKPKSKSKSTEKSSPTKVKVKDGTETEENLMGQPVPI